MRPKRKGYDELMIYNKKKAMEQLALITWCIVYIISVNNILSEYYLAGTFEVVPYYKDFSILRTIVCFAVMELCYYSMRIAKSNNRLLENVKRLFFIVFLIPAVFSYALFKQKHSLEFMIYSTLYWLSFCCFIILFNIKLHMPHIIVDFSFDKAKALGRILLVFITGGLLFLMIRSLGGIRLSITLSDVYETRAEFKEQGNYALTVLKTALGAFIFPWMIVNCFSKKRMLMGGIFAFGEIVVFSMAKDKIYLLLLILSVGIGLFGRFLFRSRYSWSTTAFLGLSGLNILALAGVMQNLIFNIFTRRFLIMPTWLQYVNYEYFYDKVKLWWRQDTFLIDKLFTPVYPRSAVQMIAEDYFRGWIGNPNCGMAGEAFTRCGYFGIVIYPLLIILLLKALSILYSNSNDETLFIISFSLTSVLSNDTITSTSFVATIIIVGIYTCIVNYLNKDLKRNKKDLVGIIKWIMLKY